MYFVAKMLYCISTTVQNLELLQIPPKAFIRHHNGPKRKKNHCFFFFFFKDMQLM